MHTPISQKSLNPTTSPQPTYPPSDLPTETSTPPQLALLNPTEMPPTQSNPTTMILAYPPPARPSLSIPLIAILTFLLTLTIGTYISSPRFPQEDSDGLRCIWQIDLKNLSGGEICDLDPWWDRAEEVRGGEYVCECVDTVKV